MRISPPRPTLRLLALLLCWAGALHAQARQVTLLHLNDVYEIEPVEGGKSGGLARVATLRQRLAAEGPLLVTHGGDYVSPSALGTAVVSGERLRGRQMVSVLNALGLDIAVLGNHEFDIGQAPLLARLTESRFTTLGANVRQKDGTPIPGTVPYALRTVSTPGGPLRLAFLGVLLPSNTPPWTAWEAPLEVAARWARVLRDSADVVVALTHLALEEDAQVAAIPGVDLVLGGHEHENYTVYRGPRAVPVLKADANARSVQVVRISLPAPGSRPRITAELLPIGGDLPEEPATAAVVASWVDSAFAGYRREGFTPRAVVATLTAPLDGREATVRTRPGALTDLMVQGLRLQFPEAELAIMNGGSVRIDDVLPVGPLTEYDVIRILPFGGRAVLAEIRGDLLQFVLDQGQRNAGSGGYLHTDARRGSAGGWEVGGAPIDPARAYRVALNDFLVTGQETGLARLRRDAPEVRMVRDGQDIRRAFISAVSRAASP